MLKVTNDQPIRTDGTFQVAKETSVVAFLKQVYCDLFSEYVINEISWSQMQKRNGLFVYKLAYFAKSSPNIGASCMGWERSENE